MLPDTNGINARWLTILDSLDVEIVRYTPRGFGADIAGEGLNKPFTLSITKIPYKFSANKYEC